MKKLLQRWTQIEDRFYRYSMDSVKWEVEKVSKSIERRLEMIFDNYGDISKMK